MRSVKKTSNRHSFLCDFRIFLLMYKNKQTRDKDLIVRRKIYSFQLESHLIKYFEKSETNCLLDLSRLVLVFERKSKIIPNLFKATVVLLCNLLDYMGNLRVK